MSDDSPPTFGKRLVHAWNAFTRPAKEEYQIPYYDLGSSYSRRPDVVRVHHGKDRAITASIYTRLSIDVASVDFRHVRLDEEGRYQEDIKSYLNECLQLDPNIDQTARAFFQDAALTLFDKGVIAIVPVDTTADPNKTDSYDILSMRVAEIVTWYPRHVRVSIYNDKLGRREEVTVPKERVAIVENPFYSLMNEPNSTLSRLTRKLALLDSVDEQTSSGKLDLIIQLPYVIKSEARQLQADKRRKDIETQLRGSQYGIAYTDGTERITQLNRPAENNLLKQVEYLTNQVYGQLGLTPAIFDGTADEATMLNYYNRTVEPIIDAIVKAMKRRFLTKTARTQNQSIEFFRDPFKLVAVTQIAEIADKFTRNEIASSNEIRTSIGWKPSKDPKADELRNSNLSAPKEDNTTVVKPTEEGELQNES